MRLALGNHTLPLGHLSEVLSWPLTSPDRLSLSGLFHLQR